ncbi:MAG: adenylate/guanylate cyclase domain-containing protein, partial [Rhizobiaceae bacterium]|nr:adenylate/guanylate cyclase domain-containing protein [Rhizobiaceae bacterium]
MSEQSEAISGHGGRRLALVIATVLLLVVTLPIAVMLDLRDLTEQVSRRQANDISKIINDIRGYYANEVVARVLQAPPGTKVIASENFRDIPGAIPIPATFSLDIGKLTSSRDNTVRYDFLSDYPFAGRDPHHLDDFEIRALQTFRADSAVQTLEHTGGGWSPAVQVAAPIRMSQACVNCHNAHPASPKHDWKAGDVRGIQAVTVSQPLSLASLGFKWMFLYFAVMVATGIGFLVMQWRQSRLLSTVNSELKEANTFLATVSLKIAKYLSPEIYKSVFSGERDVKVTAERKKLTIFFSDIVDFTATTERMQPEELTALLNEYLTEMSRIAHAHGATVDKFIGDAILAFFGDPTTRGPRDDARACLRMAVAMQQKLAELELRWRAKGIDQPFRVRMGINTGFCNVGNFGSEDRMDYTIIGAEANLAARLQSIAPPGGIVVSYETYAHVRDLVEGKAIDQISMKGITRPITPFLVERARMSEEGDATIMTATDDGLSLMLDLSRVDAERAAKLRGKLQAA